MAKSHYENFTVASWLLPKALRPHFHAVYAWCRWADDLADETANPVELLEWWRSELDACYAGTPRHPVTVALAGSVKRFSLPKQLFLDLLSAFEQDQRVKDYDDLPQLEDYCRRSANPVGRIVLRLFECADDENDRLSDHICTGLQLANFWQDVARDHAIGRKYVPKSERDRFGYSDYGACDDAFRAMLKSLCEKTRGIFANGEPLLNRLPRRARVDVTLFHRGGLAVLDAIAKQDYDVWTKRPEVGKWKKVGLLLGSLV